MLESDITACSNAPGKVVDQFAVEMCPNCASVSAPEVVVGVVVVPVVVVEVVVLPVVVCGWNVNGTARPVVFPDTRPAARLRLRSLATSITITSTSTSDLGLSMSCSSFSTSATLSTVSRTITAF